MAKSRVIKATARPPVGSGNQSGQSALRNSVRRTQRNHPEAPSFEDRFASGQARRLAGPKPSVEFDLGGSGFSFDPRSGPSGQYPDGAQLPANVMTAPTILDVATDATHGSFACYIVPGLLKSVLATAATWTTAKAVATWNTALNIDNFTAINTANSMFRVTGVYLEFIPTVSLSSGSGLSTVNLFASESGIAQPLGRDVVCPMSSVLPMREGLQITPLPIDIGHRIFYPTDNVTDAVSTWSALQIWFTGCPVSTTLGQIRLYQQLELHAIPSDLTTRIARPTPPYDAAQIQAISQSYALIDEANFVSELDSKETVFNDMNKNYDREMRGAKLARMGLQAALEWGLEKAGKGAARMADKQLGTTFIGDIADGMFSSAIESRPLRLHQLSRYVTKSEAARAQKALYDAAMLARGLAATYDFC
jgi:hypothetical protein